MTAPVGVGDLLAGKYRVDRVLGVGGMGVVVAAHHIQLDDKVAIKFMLPEALSNGDAVARFAREARAAVKIKSEHVARVIDVGTLEGGAPYLVMEYLDGCDLSAWLEEQGLLPVEQLVDFVLQACEALAEAHAYGIVHRDLKPSNLFVIRRPDGVLSVKVLDFGISKMASPASANPAASITSTSMILGSPLYMSPEQMQSSKDADARSDIWSLGIILYELLSGVSPFVADTMPELVVRVMTASPPPLKARRPDIPDGVEALVLRCLAKDRNLRFQSVGELAVALLPFGSARSRESAERISGVIRSKGHSSRPPSAPPAVPPSITPTGMLQGGTGASWETGAQPKPRHRAALLGGGAALIGVVALVLASSGRLRSAESPSPSARPPSSAAASTAPIASARPVETANAAMPAPGEPPQAAPSASAGPALPSRTARVKVPRSAAAAAPVSAPPIDLVRPEAPAEKHRNPLDIRPQ